jgi:hypothetical protein
MQMPEALAQQYDKLSEEQLFSQARGLQSSYEDAQRKAGGEPVHSLMERGMPGSGDPSKR